MKLPKNGEAPARDQGDALKQADGQGYAKHERAQVCDHASTITERMPKGHVHYAARRCAYCGCHLRWSPKPETIERQRLNRFRRARLGMCDRLSKWQRNFVSDVSQQKKVSPRQQAIIDELVATYLGEAA